MKAIDKLIKSRIDTHDISKLLQFPEAHLGEKAVVSFEGAEISYSKLYADSRELAGGLIKLGLGVQDRVSTLLPNCLEIFQLYFATAAARGIFMPLNRDLAPSEIAYMLNHATPAVIFTCETLKPKLDEALREVEKPPQVILIDESRPNGERVRFLADPEMQLPEIDPEDVVIISYTSGSTSKPKAMAFSHRVELDGAKLYEDAWGLTSEDKVLIAMSLGWTFGVNPGSFPEMRAGGSILLMEKFNPVKVLRALQDNKVTIMKGVPTMYAMMVAHVEETGMKYDLSALRLALCAGADLPQSLADKFQKTFGIQLTNFLGMSEVKLVASPRFEDNFVVPRGSVGKPPPGVKVRFVDENMEEVPVGETGEFLVHSIGWMAGYFLEPEKTRACNVDGWYVSGDLGRQDKDGFIYCVGRSREQIIRGGAKVAPAEVEEVLMAHPDVSMAAVIGVEDELYGEAVKALVVPKSSSLTKDNVMTLCQQKLAAFKVPTVIEFVQSLPIGPTGKVQKKLLR